LSRAGDITDHTKSGLMCVDPMRMAITAGVRHDVVVALFLPAATSEQLPAFWQHRPGVNEVSVPLAEAKTFGSFKVAWGSEVIRVLGYEATLFSGEEAVADASGTRPAG